MISIKKSQASAAAAWCRENTERAEQAARHRRLGPAVLDAIDLSFLMGSASWEKHPTPKQLGKLGAIANRILEATGDRVDDFWDELKRRQKTARHPQAEARPKFGPVQKMEMMVAVSADKTLTRGESTVMLILIKYTREDTDTAWPSLDVLCAESKLHKATVCRVLDKLEQKNWVERERSTGGRNKRTTYGGVLARILKILGTDADGPQATVSKKTVAREATVTRTETVAPQATRTSDYLEEDDYRSEALRAGVCARRARLSDPPLLVEEDPPPLLVEEDPPPLLVEEDEEEPLSWREYLKGRRERGLPDLKRRQSGGPDRDDDRLDADDGLDVGFSDPDLKRDYQEFVAEEERILNLRKHPEQISTWEEFEESFYKDDVDTIDYEELHPDFDTDELAHKYEMDAIAFQISFDRFMKQARTDPFPGHAKALKRLRGWLRKE